MVWIFIRESQVKIKKEFMVKFTFSFEFDPATEEIKNVKMVSREEKPARAIKWDRPVLSLQKNLYDLSPSALQLLGAEPGDKLDIRYRPIQVGKLSPVIGTNKAWGDESGNKITQHLTVSFRGKANKELAEFGDLFILEPLTEGLYQLVPFKVATKEPTIKVEEPVEVKTPVASEELEEIKEIDLDDILAGLEEDNLECKDIVFKF